MGKVQVSTVEKTQAKPLSNVYGTPKKIGKSFDKHKHDTSAREFLAAAKSELKKSG
jgi:hypothetical protein